MRPDLKGKPVHITVAGRTYHGTVISALNWGTDAEPNWYVEVAYDDKVNPYGYWKQGVDGGTVVFGEG